MYGSGRSACAPPEHASTGEAFCGSSAILGDSKTEQPKTDASGEFAGPWGSESKENGSHLERFSSACTRSGGNIERLMVMVIAHYFGFLRPQPVSDRQPGVKNPLVRRAGGF
jgi:hypothetical protein